LQAAQDGMTSPSPPFNNTTLTQNIGFAAQSPQNVGFNLPVTSTSTTSNGFNGIAIGFSHFTAQNNGNAASPLSDLDEFDVITNREKFGASPQTVNNGKNHEIVQVFSMEDAMIFTEELI